MECKLIQISSIGFNLVKESCPCFIEVTWLFLHKQAIFPFFSDISFLRKAVKVIFIDI